MLNRIGRLLAVLGLAAIMINCSGSTAANTPAAEGSLQDETTASTDAADIDEACLADVTYRARFAETDPASGAVLTEILHEVAGEQLRIEANNGTRAVVLGSDAWTYDNGDWQQLSARPVRPLRVPWVNNFVTGEEIVNQFTHIDTGEVGDGQIAARIYRPTLDEMIAEFDDRFSDSEYEPSTSSFEYWIDACDDVVYADITLTFSGEDAAIATEMEIPLTLRYTYELYDIGDDIAPVEPNTSPDPIAPQPGG